jgi:hypothetical protein
VVCDVQTKCLAQTVNKCRVFNHRVQEFSNAATIILTESDSPAGSRDLVQAFAVTRRHCASGMEIEAGNQLDVALVTHAELGRFQSTFTRSCAFEMEKLEVEVMKCFVRSPVDVRSATRLARAAERSFV